MSFVKSESAWSELVETKTETEVKNETETKSETQTDRLCKKLEELSLSNEQLQERLRAASKKEEALRYNLYNKESLVKILQSECPNPQFADKRIMTTNLIRSVLGGYEQIFDFIDSVTNGKRFYIGATCDPYSRFKAHLRFYSPQIMELLFQTRNLFDARNFESNLLYEYRGHRNCDNKTIMSCGLRGHRNVYYVYLLVK